MSISLVKKSLDLVSSEVRNVDENLDSQKSAKSKKGLVDEKKKAIALVQKVREKSKIEREVNKVDVNVQRLLGLSKANITHRKSENKLLEKVAKKRKRECKSSEGKKSAFTEEDFAKFEREYFAN